jgi:hypothetical protein
MISKFEKFPGFPKNLGENGAENFSKKIELETCCYYAIQCHYFNAMNSLFSRNT